MERYTSRDRAEKGRSNLWIEHEKSGDRETKTDEGGRKSVLDNILTDLR